MSFETNTLFSIHSHLQRFTTIKDSNNLFHITIYNDGEKSQMICALPKRNSKVILPIRISRSKCISSSKKSDTVCNRFCDLISQHYLSGKESINKQQVLADLKIRSTGGEFPIFYLIIPKNRYYPDEVNPNKISVRDLMMKLENENEEEIGYDISFQYNFRVVFPNQNVAKRVVSYLKREILGNL